MGRTAFTPAELKEIRAILVELRRSDRSRQKVLRAKLRRLGFYISDFTSDAQGFTASDLDELVRRGTITVIDDERGEEQQAPSTSSSAGSSGGIAVSVEAVADAAAPALPESFERPDLEAVGFVGWRTWDELRVSGLGEVPGGPAVYVVYRDSAADPTFLPTNPGGRFKGRDPTVAVEVLTAKWVPGARVVYIGKADEVKRRLRQFARFGAGEPVGHWGGRYVWQLADSSQLLVAWHPITWEEAAREYESRLLRRFAELHNGHRPFANLTA